MISSAGTSRAPVKSQKRRGGKGCRQLFKDSPPKTTCTAVTSSAVTTSAATTSASIVPDMFYGRGQVKAVQGVPSVHAFKQPKKEILAIQEAVALSKAHQSCNTTATASATTSITATAIDTTSSTVMACSVSSEPARLGSEGTAGQKHKFPSFYGFDDADDLEGELFPSLISDEADLELSAPPDSPPNVAVLHSPLVFSPASPGTPAESPTPDVSPDIMSDSDSFAPAKASGMRLAAAQPQSDIAPAVQAMPPSSSVVSCRSKIWQHFEKIGNGQLAKCNHCGRQLSRGKTVGHFTNSGMNQHMRLHHQAVLLRDESGVAPPSSTTRVATLAAPTTTTQSIAKQHPVPSKQPTLDQFGGFQGRGISRQQSRLITRLIGQLIAVGGAPFNMVECEPFRQLMQVVAPQYHIPSRTTFSKSVVPSIYRACVGMLKEELNRAAGQSVHFTTDIWSAPSGQHAFLALTAHWWQPKVAQDTAAPAESTSSAAGKEGHRSFLLHAEVMDEQHTAQNILRALQKMLTQWMGDQAGTKCRMGFVVSDSAANMTKAVRDGGFVGVRCTAHILQLVIRGALEEQEKKCGRLSTLLDSCRKMAGHFHRSVRDGHLLRLQQRKAGLPEHRLKQDVLTRWNSTLAMLERILEQQKALHAMSYEHNIGIGRPLGREDWAIIAQVVAVLKPFQAVTENLSQERASIAQVLPLFTYLQKKLERLLSSQQLLPGGGPLPEVVTLLRSLHSGMLKRIADLTATCPELMLAAFCDPRIKGKMALRCNALTAWRDQLIARVHDRERDMGTLLQEEEEEEERDEPISHSPTRASSAHASGAAAVWAEALDDLVGPTRMPPKKIKSAQETVGAYLSEPPLHPSVEPMDFWQEKRDMWPALSNLAQELLSCPPTSVQSERIFSVTGNILSPQRSQLSPQLMEQLAFVKVNLPKLGYPALTLDIN